MIYFHTPYYGIDELFLTAEERAPVIDRLIALKHEGLPLLNSVAGLKALKTGDWPRRMPVALVSDATASRSAAAHPTASAPTAATARAPNYLRRSGCGRAPCSGW